MQKTRITVSVCLYAFAATAQLSSSALVRRGMELRDQDRPAEALEYFRQAITKDPGDLTAHAEYVRTKAYDLGSFDEVRSEYEALMLKYPENAVYPMALATGQDLTPFEGKRIWCDAVARVSPESAWGQFARATLESPKKPDAAVAAADRAVNLDPTMLRAWSLGIYLREHRMQDLAGALSLAERLARRPESTLRVSGLYDQWRLKLLMAKDSPEAVAAVRQELQTLTANERDLDVLISVRQGWSALLRDENEAKGVESAIRRVDPTWYPERGERTYFPSGNESGVPIQGVAVNREVKVVRAVFDTNAAMTGEQKIDKLRALLPDCISPGVRRLVYQRLYRAALETSDTARIIEFGEKYQEESSRVFPEMTDPQMLARIALALADQPAHVARAAAYAREAFDATATFRPWSRPRNTDPSWFSHHTGQEGSYKSTRALALEAQGWALCQNGRCGEGEALLRQAVELRRSEGNLTRLAKVLEGLGRAREAADFRAQAEREWLESLKRRMKKTPPKDFEAKTLEGRPVRLSDLVGKVVLVNFWATWCAPCTREMPVLNDLYRKYRDRGLEILAISVDDKASRYKVERFVKEQKLGFPVLHDSGAASLYEVAVYPTNLLIDQKGFVRLRFNLLERRSFEAIVEQLLNGEL